VKALRALIKERKAQAASATVAAVNVVTDVDLTTIGVDSTATTKDAAPAFKCDDVSTVKDVVVAAVTGNGALTKPMQYAFNGNLLQLEMAAKDFGLVLQKTRDTPHQVQSETDAGIYQEGKPRDGAQGNALKKGGAQVEPARRYGDKPREASYPPRGFQGCYHEHVERAVRRQW
jgi:hypothetical protein